MEHLKVQWELLHLFLELSAKNMTNPSVSELTTTIIRYEWIDRDGIIRLTLLNNNITYLSNINENASLYYLISHENCSLILKNSPN